MLSGETRLFRKVCSDGETKWPLKENMMFKEAFHGGSNLRWKILESKELGLIISELIYLKFTVQTVCHLF